MLQNNFQLLKRIKSGDELAFKEVHKLFYSRLYYFIFEFVRLHDITENIIQDTFVALWNKRIELREDTNLSAYLFTVARNNALYKLRDAQYRLKLFKSDGMEGSEINLNTGVLEEIDLSSIVLGEIERIIEETLSELPPKCREVFYRSRFEEKKNREIAVELGISEKVVEKHISRALKSFRHSLRDYLPIVAFLFYN
ncbi:MAG: RNA polymerase sigma-70 factor [Mangrovibacterium sp.]